MSNANHTHNRGLSLPDTQQTQDTRGIEIDQVGVSNVRYPLTLPLRDGGEINTVASLSLTVSLFVHLLGRLTPNRHWGRCPRRRK